MNCDHSAMRSLRPRRTIQHRSTAYVPSGLIGATCEVLPENLVPLGSDEGCIIRDRHDDGSYAVYVPRTGQTEIVEAHRVLVTSLPPIVR